MDYISHSVKIVKKVEIYKSIDLFIYQKHSKITLFVVFGLGGLYSPDFIVYGIKKRGPKPSLCRFVIATQECRQFRLLVAYGIALWQPSPRNLARCLADE